LPGWLDGCPVGNIPSLEILDLRASAFICGWLILLAFLMADHVDDDGAGEDQDDVLAGFILDFEVVAPAEQFLLEHVSHWPFRFVLDAPQRVARRFPWKQKRLELESARRRRPRGRERLESRRGCIVINNR